MRPQLLRVPHAQKAVLPVALVVESVAEIEAQEVDFPEWVVVLIAELPVQEAEFPWEIAVVSAA